MLGPDNTTYRLDLSRIGMIYLSDNPDEFMPEAERSALVYNRLRNRQMNFYLVYSAKCLNQDALRSIHIFAKVYEISLINFEENLKPLPDEYSFDSVLYNYAKQEIVNSLKKTGGSLKAASNCIRLLDAFLERCGNFIEINKPFDFTNLEKHHKVNAPVVIPTRITSLEIDKIEVEVPGIANYFIGTAVAHNNPSQMHPDAKACLNDVKAKVADNYNNANAFNFLSEFSGVLSATAQNKTVIDFVCEAFLQITEIVEYRQAIETSELAENLRRILLHESVVKCSGADTWFFLFKEEIHTLNKTHNMGSLLEKLRQYSLENNGLVYFVENNHTVNTKQLLLEQIPSFTPHHDASQNQSIENNQTGVFLNPLRKKTSPY